MSNYINVNKPPEINMPVFLLVLTSSGHLLPKAGFYYSNMGFCVDGGFCIDEIKYWLDPKGVSFESC